MFLAALTAHAIGTARRFLLPTCISVVVGPAWAQSQDVFGPPTAPPAAPVVSPETLDPKVDSQAEPVNVDLSEIAKPKSRQTRVRTGEDSRFLGPAPATQSKAGRLEKDAANETAATGGIGKSAWATSIVLALIVMAALGVRAVAKRQGGLMAAIGPGGRAPGGVLEVLGRFPIGRGQSLVLLKIDQRVLLLSQSGGGRLGAGAGMNTLCEIVDPEEVASILIKSRDDGGESIANRFRSMLAGQSGNDFVPRLAESITPGRMSIETDSVDSAEIWDESQAADTIADRSQDWPVERETSALGSLRSRLQHWRDVEESA